MTRLADFSVGDRVVIAKGSGPGTVTKVRNLPYQKGYLTIVFDSDPGRPAQYPWRLIRKVEA